MYITRAMFDYLLNPEVGEYYLAGPLDGVELVLESLYAPFGRPHLPFSPPTSQLCRCVFRS